MDWALSFTPSDVMDITKRQALAQVNPKIVLSIRVGKGMVSKALPILLEDINFTGKMRYVQIEPVISSLPLLTFHRLPAKPQRPMYLTCPLRLAPFRRIVLDTTPTHLIASCLDS
jgi:hypothetical protein